MLDKLTVEREFKTEGDFCFWPRGADRDLIYFWPETTGGKKKKTNKTKKTNKHQTTGKIHKTTVSGETRPSGNEGQ